MPHENNGNFIDHSGFEPKMNLSKTETQTYLFFVFAYELDLSCPRCGLLSSCVVVTTWEIDRNAESQALQNLLFNKILQVIIYIHI